MPFEGNVNHSNEKIDALEYKQQGQYSRISVDEVDVQRNPLPIRYLLSSKTCCLVHNSRKQRNSPQQIRRTSYIGFLSRTDSGLGGRVFPTSPLWLPTTLYITSRPTTYTEANGRLTMLMPMYVYCVVALVGGITEVYAFVEEVYFDTTST